MGMVMLQLENIYNLDCYKLIQF